MLFVLLVDNSKILCWRIMVSSCIFQITLKFVVQKLEIIMCGETISILILTNPNSFSKK